MKITTLCFLLKKDTAKDEVNSSDMNNQILLAMKKRGFGAGKLNGVGGKVGPGENIEAAMSREIKEEISVVVQEADLLKVAIIDFHFEGKSDWDQQCHVFISMKWTGEPQESEEMKPEWYSTSNIPYNIMWAADSLWIPDVLVGKKVAATINFNVDGSFINSHEIKEVNSFN
jgi:8-oxo-dGTP diphosphatase